jgi:ribonuclease R
MPLVNRETVMEFFRDNPRPLQMRDIVRSMRLSSPQSRALKKVLRQMVDEGAVVRTRRGMYGPAEQMELVTGYFEAHRDGYGFVIPEKPGERDLFIPPRHTLSAMEGDRVAASLLSRRTRSGRIVRIVERSHKRVAGTVDTSMGSCFVRPRSHSIPFDIHIPSGGRKGARQGQPVLVEIETYPTAKRPAVGRIVSVMERPLDANSDVKAIIDEFNLPKRFPSGVSSEAKDVSLKKPGSREDLRGLNTVTIDGETAKDFDDAISIKSTSGGYTLWVHIADVSHYVREGTRLDLEARDRGTSVYFPGMVIPMLPKALSEDVCSLVPGSERAAFTVEMEFDRFGNQKDARFYPSLIISDERMTYTSVARILLDRDATERNKYSSLLDDFELMLELADLIRDVRMARGSLDFDLPEPEVVLDITGNPENIIRFQRNRAHMIIEDFMIAANEAVASFLETLDAPCLFRIHEEPDTKKVEDVLKVAGMKVSSRKASSPDIIMTLAAKVKDTPLEEAVNYMILRSMKQARYSEYNVGHFGLASESYCHFTSPIRRYPDLIVHRILREAVSGKGISEGLVRSYRESLPDIAFESSRRERLAMEAERDVLDAMRAWFMRDKVGDEFPAMITGITPKGIRVRLDEFYVEGFIALSDMTDDYYIYDEDSLALRGRHTHRTMKFGQPLTVRVDRVDIEERRVIFGISEI